MQDLCTKLEQGLHLSMGLRLREKEHYEIIFKSILIVFELKALHRLYKYSRNALRQLPKVSL